jgi:hypothetical protein
MKRKVRGAVQGRPTAPRVEPSAREMEVADIAFEAVPKRSWLRVHPF